MDAFLLGHGVFYSKSVIVTLTMTTILSQVFTKYPSNRKYFSFYIFHWLLEKKELFSSYQCHKIGPGSSKR